MTTSEGTASFHFVRIEAVNDGYGVEGRSHEDVTEYHAPELTVNGWALSGDGPIELMPDEDDPDTWILAETGGETLDLHQ